MGVGGWGGEALFITKGSCWCCKPGPVQCQHRVLRQLTGQVGASPSAHRLQAVGTREGGGGGGGGSGGGVLYVSGALCSC